MQPDILRLGKNSPRLKDLRYRLRHRQHGEVILDGKRLLQDALRWKIPIFEIYLSEAVLQAGIPEGVAEETQKYVLDDEVFRKLAPTRNSQGILSFVAEPEFPAWTAIEGFGLYLEAIQDPHNVGAIIRSAAAFGARTVWLGPGCADPFGPRTVRASAGAVFRLNTETNLSLDTALGRVRATNGSVWATGSGGAPISECHPSNPLLLLLGSEGPGLSPQALAHTDRVVGIALDKEIESLNVAVAAGVMLAQIRAILPPR